MSAPKSSGTSAWSAGSQAQRAVRFKLFRGGPMISWEDLCEEAARFASTLPSQDVISISHSDSHRRGVVAVWFWSS